MSKRIICRFYSLIIVLRLLTFSETWAGDPITPSGMVVSSHAMASNFGLEILQSGGNAIDAAVAAALMIGVVEPYGSGLGGGGAMLIYLRDLDSLTYINYYACAPDSLPFNFNSRVDGDKARSVLVPGTVAGLHYALAKYGTWGWSELIREAVRRLTDGFNVTDNLHRNILDSYEKLLQYPETRARYLPNDLPPEPGTTITNPALLNTLLQLADYGADWFYRGAIADSIETAMIRYGGTLRKADLAKYQVRELRPLRSSYRGFDVVSAPAPQSGVSIIEALNILEFKDLKSMGSFLTSPSSFHLMAEVLRRVYFDRTQYLGDPAFDDVPVELLISKAFARSRFQTIDPTKMRPIQPEEIDMKNEPAPTKKLPPPDGSTTHLSVVDRNGNAVALTQTLNYFWGSGITVAGFLLNNGMTSFSVGGKEAPNRISPGKQPRTTIAPTMLFQDGQLVMVIGSPGAGRIISTLVQVISNIIDFGMSPDAANSAPRFYSRNWKDKVIIEDRFPKSLLTALEKMGYSFQTMGEMDSFFGGVQLIMFDRQHQQLIGCSDPRRQGQAASD